MDADLASLNGRTCCRPRCPFPVAGVGEPYGLCVKHGHEERNRRLAEHDARAKAPAVRPITRGLTTPPVTRPLSAIVGAEPQEFSMPPTSQITLSLRLDADAHPDKCRIADCEALPHCRGLCSRHLEAARRNNVLNLFALPAQIGGRRPATPKPTNADLSPAAYSEAYGRGEGPIPSEHATAKVHELKALSDQAAKHRADVTRLEGEANALRDALAAAEDKLRAVCSPLNIDAGGDLAKQAENIAAWMSATVEAANALDARKPDELVAAVDAAIADTRLPSEPAKPASRLYDLYQLGHVHRGIVMGRVSDAGLFLADDGSVFGAIFSAVPVQHPALGEPGPDEDVWVRTSIDEVTPNHIHTADGGRYRRSEWGSGRFARPVKAGVSPVNNIDPADDIPF